MSILTCIRRDNLKRIDSLIRYQLNVSSFVIFIIDQIFQRIKLITKLNIYTHKHNEYSYDHQVRIECLGSNLPKSCMIIMKVNLLLDFFFGIKCFLETSLITPRKDEEFTD